MQRFLEAQARADETAKIQPQFFGTRVGASVANLPFPRTVPVIGSTAKTNATSNAFVGPVVAPGTTPSSTLGTTVGSVIDPTAALGAASELKQVESAGNIADNSATITDPFADTRARPAASANTATEGSQVLTLQQQVTRLEEQLKMLNLQIESSVQALPISPVNIREPVRHSSGITESSRRYTPAFGNLLASASSPAARPLTGLRSDEDSGVRSSPSSSHLEQLARIRGIFRPHNCTANQGSGSVTDNKPQQSSRQVEQSVNLPGINSLGFGGPAGSSQGFLHDPVVPGSTHAETPANIKRPIDNTGSNSSQGPTKPPKRTKLPKVPAGLDWVLQKIADDKKIAEEKKNAAALRRAGEQEKTNEASTEDTVTSGLPGPSRQPVSVHIPTPQLLQRAQQHPSLPLASLGGLAGSIHNPANRGQPQVVESWETPGPRQTPVEPLAGSIHRADLGYESRRSHASPRPHVPLIPARHARQGSRYDQPGPGFAILEHDIAVNAETARIVEARRRAMEESENEGNSDNEPEQSRGRPRHRRR